MEKLIISFLIVVTIFQIQLRYIIGKLSEPAGTIFLGTVHYPPDYFYYLSQIVQGQTHGLFSRMLFTTEKMPYILVGWQNAVWGFFFSRFGVGVIETYQLAVIISLGLFLILAYILLNLIFPNEKWKRILAFFFFTTSTSIWKIIPGSNGAWDFSYFWYWYNHGFTQIRFGPTPHHLLANSFFVLLVILSILWFQNKRRKIILILGMIISSIIVASISPVYWGLVVLVVFFTPLLMTFWSRLRSYDLKKYFASLRLEMLIAPFVFIFISGLPVAIYVRQIFLMAPYSYSNIWESQQQVWVNLFWLVVGSGLVIIFAFLGIYNYLREKNISRIVTVILLLTSSLFYFSPLPMMLKLTNIRFWSGAIYIIWGSLATEGVLFLVGLFKKKKWQYLSAGLLMVTYLLSIIPTHYVAVREMFQWKLTDSFYFLSKEAVRAYQKAAMAGSEESVYLVQWPFDESFPALTGRKSFFGFYMLTIDSQNKEKQVFQFFDGKMSAEEAKRFLTFYKIDYIIGYPWTPKLYEYPFVKEVYKNNLLGVYQVNI